MQMKLLEQGNATMGIWLGKQLLGQTDQITHELHGDLRTVILMPSADRIVEHNTVLIER